MRVDREAKHIVHAQKVRAETKSFMTENIHTSVNIDVNLKKNKDSSKILSPSLRRSPGEGNGNHLQMATPFNFCLENPMDRGTWQATDRKVTKSQTRLRN